MVIVKSCCCGCCGCGCSTICVDVRSGSWLKIPLRLCLLPSSCTVRTDVVPGDCGLIGGAAGGGEDRNPAREAKRQRDYLKDYFNNEGAVAWQDGTV